jgi:hypothetical protein
VWVRVCVWVWVRLCVCACERERAGPALFVYTTPDKRGRMAARED